MLLLWLITIWYRLRSEAQFINLNSLWYLRALSLNSLDFLLIDIQVFFCPQKHTVDLIIHISKRDLHLKKFNCILVKDKWDAIHWVRSNLHMLLSKDSRLDQHWYGPLNLFLLLNCFFKVRLQANKTIYVTRLQLWGHFSPYFFNWTELFGLL